MKGALSQATARLMVFKLDGAAKNLGKTAGQNQCRNHQGVKFRDGIEVAAETKSGR